MANIYAGTDLEQQAIANERRRQIAQAMLEQSQQQVQPFQSTGRMVAPMSWAQGLAQLGKAYWGRKGEEKANSVSEALAKQYQQKQDAAVAAYTKRAAGSPEIPAAQAAGPGGPQPSVGPPQPAVQPDPRGALFGLMADPYARPQAVQAAVMGEQWKREDKKDAEELAAKVQTAKAEIEQRAEAARLRSEDTRLSIEQRRQAEREHNDLMRALDSNKSALPKPQAGFRWKEDGSSQEPIPGGPADLKIKAQAAKENAAHKVAVSTLDSEIENINKLIGPVDKPKLHPGLAAATGPVDVRFPTVLPDTANAESLIESMQSKASINALRDIRSGGSQSIGQITEREWPRLESMKATLQAKQGTDQFVQSLQDYRNELLQTKKDLDAALSGAGADLGSQPPAAGVPEFATEAEMDAAVAAGKLQRGAKVKVGGVSGTAQ